MEIELKFAIPPRSVTRLLRHRLLRGRGATRVVHSVYYDTPEFDLWQQHLAFRVRRDSAKWMQTLKCGGSALAGLQQRLELETELVGSQPDFAALAALDAKLPLPAAGAFAPYALHSRMLPAFTTHFTRSSKTITYNKILTLEMAIDRGFISGAGSTLPIGELELELKSGPPAALFEFALVLLQDVPLVIENRTKAERGYALLRGEGMQPAKAHAAVLPSATTAIDAFRRTVGALLAQVQDNRQGVIEGRDPEYLHQMRVAVRRLRSVFGLYAHMLPRAAVQPLLAEIKWLARALGPARDADVFVTEIWPPLRAALQSNPLLSCLDARWETQRRAAAAKMCRALAARRYQRVILGVGHWLSAEGWRDGAASGQLAAFDCPAREFACRVIERRDDKVSGRGHAPMRMDDAQLHALRIRVKKLRYAADTFGSLFDSAAMGGMMNALSRLQDILGAMNDVRVAKQQVARALADSGGRTRRALRAELVAWHDARSAALRKKLPAAWRAYRHAQTFW